MFSSFGYGTRTQVPLVVRALYSSSMALRQFRSFKACICDLGTEEIEEVCRDEDGDKVWEEGEGSS